MTSMTSTLPAPKPAHRTLLLLAAVFVLPFVIGTGLYWSGWRPEKFANHGELLQPPRVLPEDGLTHADGRPLPTSELRGKWLLVMPVNGSCDTPCLQNLKQMHQVHIALNKEQSRLQRVFIGGDVSDPALVASQQLQHDFPDLVVAATKTNAAGTAWHSALDGSGHAIYIVDPLGNIMMRYAEPADMRGVLKDLERLLKYSWIR